MVQWLQIGQIRRNVKAFLQDQRGSVLAIMGFGLVIAAGVTSLAVDVGYLYGLKGRLQATADFAALAAVTQLPDEDAARTTALEYAAKNMPASKHGGVLANADVVAGNWDAGTRTFTPGDTPVNAVRVVTRRAQANGNAAELFFARVFGFSETDIAASAIAGFRPGPACVIALEPSEDDAILINNATMSVTGCGVHVNSTDPAALYVNAGGSLTADAVSVTGGDASTGSVSPVPETGAPPIPDPLAGLTPPSYGGCLETNLSIHGEIRTLSEGVYCGGITIKNSNVTFNPGIYIIKDGKLKTSSTNTITGDGVSFFFTGSDANLNLAGNGSLTWTAPTSGELDGILFFGDPNNPANKNHSISGKMNKTFTGSIYFPVGTLQFSGQSTGYSVDGMVIANQIKISGNGGLTINNTGVMPPSANGARYSVLN